MEYEIISYPNLIERLVEFSNNLFPLRLTKDIPRQYAVILSHGINTQTMCSIRLLVIEKHANDIAVLLRSMFESVIDMGILSLSLIKDDIERFQNFAAVENYRLHLHMNRIKPELTQKIEKEKNKIALNESYTKMLSYKRKFTDLNSWCGLNLLQRCKIIDKYYPSTVSDNVFYEFLYCQIFRICSCSTHRTFLGLSYAKLKKERKIENGKWVFETNIERLLHVCRYGIFVYLSSIRYLGSVFKIHKCESFYQSMSKRLFEGRITQLGKGN